MRVIDSENAHVEVLNEALGIVNEIVDGNNDW